MNKAQQRWLRIAILPLVLLGLCLAASVGTLKIGHQKIGQPFPGYLAFENRVAGPFYLSDWPAHSEGKVYPHLAAEIGATVSPFSSRDYLWTVVLPLSSGLAFFLLGVGLFFYLFPRAGMYPLLFFHFLVANLFILLPEAQLSQRFNFPWLLCVAFIPPTMIHFTLLISEMLIEVKRRRWVYTLPYLLSLLLVGPYLYVFYFKPLSWIWMNDLFLGYGILAYIFWFLRLLRIYQNPHFKLDKILVRYLLIGQVLGFLAPMMGALALAFGKGMFPLNLASPLILLFPLSLLFGVIPGKRKQLETYFIQSEKRQSFGDLLAGLAHELNNPLTFIYSNMEPMREVVQQLKDPSGAGEAERRRLFTELESMMDNMEEGATRAKDLLEKFRNFPKPRPEKKEELDLNALIDRSIELLAHKWKDKIRIEKKFEEIPKIRGFSGELAQVFTNILGNAFDATPANGRVQVSTHRVSAGIKIQIRDSGKGIPREELGRIFDPFFTTKAQGEGTGLGLAITLQIIKGHRGSIEVKSEAGKGTEFLIVLPLS